MSVAVSTTINGDSVEFLRTPEQKIRDAATVMQKDLFRTVPLNITTKATNSDSIKAFFNAVASISLIFISKIQKIKS